MQASTIAYTSVQDFYKVAEKRLPKTTFDYYRSGAEYMVTAEESSRVFDHHLLKPTVFFDKSSF